MEQEPHRLGLARLRKTTVFTVHRGECHERMMSSYIYSGAYADCAGDRLHIEVTIPPLLTLSQRAVICPLHKAIEN